MKTILILNGSPNGSKGNCNKLIQIIQQTFSKSVAIKVVHLAESKKQNSLVKNIKDADGFVFVTGTYWDSWGSPLQKFLEDATDLEGTKAFIGKPCAVFVLNHSVGGKAVLSRLQGVLSTFGCLIPPMSGMVYSLVTQLALKNSKSVHKDDLWTLDDIEMIVQNLMLSLEITIAWKIWPVDRKNFRKNWI
ncbi:hypothetical protein CIK05_08960 [Bdellovibrio sp. qaytius]|nr:hypothetical protein CIK05_08960 [Bdellovibrio sp. qaytius]